MSSVSRRRARACRAGGHPGQQCRRGRPGIVRSRRSGTARDRCCAPTCSRWRSCPQLLVPSIVARGRGGVLNIGSGAGLAVMPAGAAYAPASISSTASARRCAPTWRHRRGRHPGLSRPRGERVRPGCRGCRPDRRRPAKLSEDRRGPVREGRASPLSAAARRSCFRGGPNGSRWRYCRCCPGAWSAAARPRRRGGFAARPPDQNG